MCEYVYDWTVKEWALECWRFSGSVTWCCGPWGHILTSNILVYFRIPAYYYSLPLCLFILRLAILHFLSVQRVHSTATKSPSFQFPNMCAYDLWAFRLCTHARPIQSYKVLISNSIRFVFSKGESQGVGQMWRGRMRGQRTEETSGWWKAGSCSFSGARAGAAEVLGLVAVRWVRVVLWAFTKTQATLACRLVLCQPAQTQLCLCPGVGGGGAQKSGFF